MDEEYMVLYIVLFEYLFVEYYFDGLENYFYYFDEEFNEDVYYYNYMGRFYEDILYYYYYYIVLWWVDGINWMVGFLFILINYFILRRF